jgi:hypothetical protein
MSVFQDALFRAFDVEVDKDATWLTLAWDTLRKVRQGWYDAAWQDVFFQVYSRPLTLEDAFGFALCWSDLVAGKIAYCRLDIGHRPHRDSAVESNNRLLDKLKHLSDDTGEIDLFEGHFQGGAGDNDGWVRAKRAITMNCHDAASQKLNIVKAAAEQYPLEVGYTEVGTTLGHLRREGMLARWPYGSESIYLLRYRAINEPTQPFEFLAYARKCASC